MLLQKLALVASRVTAAAAHSAVSGGALQAATQGSQQTQPLAVGLVRSLLHGISRTSAQAAKGSNSALWSVKPRAGPCTHSMPGSRRDISTGSSQKTAEGATPRSVLENAAEARMKLNAKERGEDPHPAGHQHSWASTIFGTLVDVVGITLVSACGPCVVICGVSLVARTCWAHLLLPGPALPALALWTCVLRGQVLHANSRGRVTHNSVPSHMEGLKMKRRSGWGNGCRSLQWSYVSVPQVGALCYAGYYTVAYPELSELDVALHDAHISLALAETDKGKSVTPMFCIHTHSCGDVAALQFMNYVVHTLSYSDVLHLCWPCFCFEGLAQL